MDKREKVIEGLRWALDNTVDPINDFRFAGYDGSIVMLNEPIIKDAIDLLEALDVTPEELERLKKCRHECKIDCLLEHYNNIKAERDALLKAQEPVEPIRMNHDENKYRDHYRCPICDDDLAYEQQYCAGCGRTVKW